MHGHHTKTHYVAEFSNSWHPPSLYEPQPLALHTTHKKDTRVERSNDPTAPHITSKDDKKHSVEPDLPKFAAISCTDVTDKKKHYISDFRTIGVHLASNNRNHGLFT